MNIPHFGYILLITILGHIRAQNGYHYERNSIGTISSNDNKLSYFNPKGTNQSQQSDEAYRFFNPKGMSLTQESFRSNSNGIPSNSNAFTGGDKYLPPPPPSLVGTTQAPIVTKQFHLFSAPEDSEETTKTKHFVFGRPQKNYRVVFIKAPSSDRSNIRLSAEYAPQEEKTVIYVLSKKNSDVEIGEIATPAPTQPPKPEVFFIKYKTSEEAAAAQKEIQDQYDYLGGTTEFTDEGLAPIKSVIGSLDGVATNGGYEYKRGQSEVYADAGASGGYDYKRGSQSGSSVASSLSAPSTNDISNTNGIIKEFSRPMRYYF